MNEDHPADQEVRRAVKKIHNRGEGSVARLGVEDLKTWLIGFENKEKVQEKGEE